MKGKYAIAIFSLILTGLMISAALKASGVLPPDLTNQNSPYAATFVNGTSITTLVSPSLPSVKLQRIVSGFVASMQIVSAKDGTGRLFLVDQTGFVFIIYGNGTIQIEPFLSVKNTFNAGESVYVSGMGFPASSTFDISIVNDVVSWTSMSGLPIPASLSAGLHNVTSAASGMIAVNLLWSSPTLGNYDIVVDVNRNGVYDPSIDAIDSDDVVTAGVAVVPELGAIAIIGMLGASTVLLAFDRRGKRRPDQWFAKS